MIIRGILDNSLNGQLCVRGFAPIKELARISKADYAEDTYHEYDNKASYVTLKKIAWYILLRR